MTIYGDILMQDSADTIYGIIINSQELVSGMNVPGCCHVEQDMDFVGGKIELIRKERA
jgi:hypothetical protein